ncbi:SUMF1/EgtB/PvdO family nonheme iron enzyme [Spirochaeta dissipatitropha]
MNKLWKYLLVCALLLFVLASCTESDSSAEVDRGVETELTEHRVEAVESAVAVDETETEAYDEQGDESDDRADIGTDSPAVPELHIEFAPGDDPGNVRNAVILPDTDSMGNAVSWQSSKPEYISINGEVNRPDFSESDQDVLLTASIQREETEINEYLLRVLKLPGVVFNANGGRGNMQPQTVAEKLAVQLNENQFSAPTGTVFAGWSRSPDGQATYADRGNFTAGEIRETILYAVWATDVYAIRYHDLFDGRNNPDNPVSYSSRSADVVLLDPVRRGYRFTAWHDGPSAQANQIRRIVQGTERDILLYARWNPERYTLRFDSAADDVRNPSSVTVTFDSTYGTLPVLERLGYHFLGWTRESDGVRVSSESIVQTDRDHVLTAVWSPVEYSIRYSSMYDAVNHPENPVVYTIIENQINLLPAERASYHFDGWFDNPEYKGDRITHIPASSVGEREYYARWLYAFPGIEYRDMVVVPGGTFLQRATEGDPRQFYNRVTSFEIARYPVTYELWYAVKSWADANGYDIGRPGREGSHGPIGREPQRFPHEPVSTVSWRDSVAWLNAYSEMKGLEPVYYIDRAMTQPVRSSSTANSPQTAAGQQDNPFVNWNATGYRLPTEGEWQFAASYRDGFEWTPHTFASGATATWTNETASSLVAWYFDNADTGSGPKTQPVGSKGPNALGIYDMSGNVWEWCWDWWAEYPAAEQSDYRGASTGTQRITRGGAWRYVNSLLQIGRRDGIEPWYATTRTGFRVVRSRE